MTVADLPATRLGRRLSVIAAAVLLLVVIVTLSFGVAFAFIVSSWRLELADLRRIWKL